VVSLAILADDKPQWRPHCYRSALWGCQVFFEFVTIKLLDYRAKQSELAASRNPFAVVILAHLAALATKKNPQQRLESKLNLTRGLYEKGLDKTAILNLYAFIDWTVALPEPLELEYMKEIERFEEEKQMTYITSAERIGIQKGKQEGIIEGEKVLLLRLLQRKFGILPQNYRQRIESASGDALLHWADSFIAANALSDVFEGA
jgi:hypothetical protein